MINRAQILFISFIAILTIGLMTYFVVFRERPKEPQLSMISLEDVSGKVEFIKTDGSIRDTLGGNDRFRPGDTIRTGADSSVAIKFKDGGIVKLNPSTVISLQKAEKKDVVQLLLEEGQTEISRTGSKTSIGIKSGKLDKPVQLVKGKAKFSTTSEGLAVESGKDKDARVGLGEGSDIDLGKSSKIALGKKEGKLAIQLQMGEIEVSRHKSKIKSVKVSFGEGDDFILMREGQAKLKVTEKGVRVKTIMGEIIFNRGGKATRIEPGTELLVSLGEVKILSRETQLESGDENREMVSVPMTVAEPEINIGPKIKMMQPVESQIIRAEEGSKIKIYIDGNLPWIGFTWEEQTAEHTAILEVSRSSNFDSMALRWPVRGNDFVCNDLQPGKYFWRVVKKFEKDSEKETGIVGRLWIDMDPNVYKYQSKDNKIIQLLKIDAPRTGQQPRDGNIQIKGRVAKGFGLSVNQEPIHLDNRGFFKQEKSGLKRGTLLIFCLMGKKTGPIYFLRQLG